MLKATLVFIAIMVQTIICMLVYHYAGLGYSLILFMGFTIADCAFIGVLSKGE